MKKYRYQTRRLTARRPLARSWLAAWAKTALLAALCWGTTLSAKAQAPQTQAACEASRQFFWNGYQCQKNRFSERTCGCQSLAGAVPRCVEGSGKTSGPGWWYVHTGGSDTRWTQGTNARCCTAQAWGGFEVGAVSGWGQAPCAFADTKENCELLLNNMGCWPQASTSDVFVPQPGKEYKIGTGNRHLYYGGDHTGDVQNAVCSTDPYLTGPNGSSFTFERSIDGSYRLRFGQRRLHWRRAAGEIKPEFRSGPGDPVFIGKRWDGTYRIAFGEHHLYCPPPPLLPNLPMNAELRAGLGGAFFIAEVGEIPVDRLAGVWRRGEKCDCVFVAPQGQGLVFTQCECNGKEDIYSGYRKVPRIAANHYGPFVFTGENHADIVVRDFGSTSLDRVPGAKPNFGVFGPQTGFVAYGPGVTVGDPNQKILDQPRYTLAECLAACSRGKFGPCKAATFHEGNECKLFSSFRGIQSSNNATKILYVKEE